MELHMNKNDFIVSKTDLQGRIIYGNEYFITMSGYSEEELLNAPHNILRHEDMPKIVFELLWSRIKDKKSINAYVKNKTKNADYYWVFATVTPSFDKNNNIIAYYSVRRKPSSTSVELIQNLYKELLNAEKIGGVNASKRLLDETLNTAGVSYDKFIIDLQK